jgi:hypothetical protein
MLKQPSEKPSDPVLDAARRRALKVGLVGVPMLLTLRNKPAFGGGKDKCGPSMSLSAAQSHHVVGQPGCEPWSFH